MIVQIGGNKMRQTASKRGRRAFLIALLLLGTATAGLLKLAYANISP